MIPEGWVTTQEAAKIMGYSAPSSVAELAKQGKIPKGKWTRIAPNRCGYIWEKRTLPPAKAKAPSAKSGKATGKSSKHLSPTALAFLARLRRYADKTGFVDGDATDIVVGNPARQTDWDAINELAQAKALEWGLDGWDRLTFKLADEDPKTPGHSKERKAF